MLLLCILSSCLPILASVPSLDRGGVPGRIGTVTYDDGTARNWSHPQQAPRAVGALTIADGVRSVAGPWQRVLWPVPGFSHASGVTAAIWYRVETNTVDFLWPRFDWAYTSPTNQAWIDGAGTVTAQSGGSNLYADTAGAFTDVPARTLLLVFTPGNTGRVESAGSWPALNGGSVSDTQLWAATHSGARIWPAGATKIGRAHV